MTSLGENNAGSSHLMVASPSEELQRHIRENPIRQEWEFEFTEGGAEALSLLKRRRYQGLLLNRRLRDLDVHEVISVATSLCPAIPIVVFDSETGQLDLSKATPRERLSTGGTHLLEC